MNVNDSDLRMVVEALNNISDAFVIYDADGCLVVCNDNFKQLYAYTDEEARPGVHFSELGRIDMQRGNVVVGDEIGGGEQYLARKAAYRRKLTGSFVVRLADGRWIRTTDRATANGGFVSIQTDITDMKNAEVALTRAKESAESANRAKSDFLANMSHELRTPLNAIIGFAAVLQQEIYGPHWNKKYKEYAADIGEAGTHLLGLINDILDLSKIEHGPVALDERVVDPVELNAWCINLFDELARRSELQLTAEVLDDSFLLLGDPQRIRQVAVNLLSNAVKFTPVGGAVTLTWGLVNGEAELRVTDSGVGIEPEFLPQLFEPFRQGGAGNKRQIEGAGLGLALVKQFVDLHGGSVNVESTPGEGSTFIVRLPFDRVIAREQRAKA